MQVDARGTHLAGGERVRVLPDRADRDGLLTLLLGHDEGLHVDGDQDAVVARQGAVPRLVDLQVDIGEDEPGEALLIDGLGNGLVAEPLHQFPPNVKAVDAYVL